MAGHSRWTQIKHKKSQDDARRSQLFAKLSQEIEAAARAGGADPSTNPHLASLIVEARKIQFPKENVASALVRAAKHAESVAGPTFWLEAYAPGGIAMLIEIDSGFKESVLPQLKQVLEEQGGKMARAGEVRWRFDANLNPNHTISASREASTGLKQCLRALQALDGVRTIVHNAAQ